MTKDINTTEKQKNRDYYVRLLGCIANDLDRSGYELDAAIEDGFQIDFADKCGRTLLHWAANYHVIRPLKDLISKGADINKKDKHGYTPFGIVCWNYVSFGNPKGLKKGLNWVYVPPDYNTEDSCVIKDLIFYNIEDEDCRFKDVDTQSDIRWKKFEWVDPDAQKRRDELKKYIKLLKRKKTDVKKKVKKQHELVAQTLIQDLEMYER